MIYPSLAKLSKKVFCVPASSALVEKVFSASGNICIPARCRLKPKTLEKLTFVTRNLHVFLNISDF